MPVSLEELDRIADEQYANSHITSSIYCGSCGYNLRSLPYMHVCPECGRRYNAIPRKMTGIFQPTAVEFPFGDVASTVLCGAMGVSIVWRSWNPAEWGTLMMGISFCVLTLFFGAKSVKRLVHYYRGRFVARRIAMDETDRG